MTTTVPDQYRVAAIQFDPLLGATANNIARLLTLVETAAQGGARLIVLPEMATTGACWYNRDEIRPHVEPIPGPTTEAFAAVARRYDCYIVVGMPEVDLDTGIFYNSAALVGPTGVVGVYRKTHPFISDLKWAKNGDLDLPVWDTPLGRIGILICMAGGQVEPARLLALRGADVLCFPTNWLGEKAPGPAWSTRAFENGCYLIAADRYGVERDIQFSGGSCVLNPDGTIQTMQDADEGIVYGEVRLAAARAKTFNTHHRSEKLAARRPELYDNLTLNCYLSDPYEFHGMYGHRPLPTGSQSLVAVVQFTPQPNDPAANLALIEQALAELPASLAQLPITLADGVALVVFPEYALTGCPNAERPDVALSPDEVAGWHARIVDLARRYALHLVVGYAEQCDEQIFSAALLAGPEGVIAHYRKTHVVGNDAAWCSPGAAKPPVVDLPLGRVGLLLGTDLCFPEMARSLAIEGCDLLLVPGGPDMPPSFALGPTAVPLNVPWSIDTQPHHFHLARQRGIENNCYIAFASLPQPYGIGSSAVFGPGPIYRVGEHILDPCGDGVVVRLIDTSHLDTPYPRLAPVRTKDLIRMRQPHLYAALQRMPGKNANNGSLEAKDRNIVPDHIFQGGSPWRVG